MQQVTQLITAQRNFYLTGATQSVAYRKAQLTKLQAVIEKYDSEIIAALYADLRKSEFEAYATEVGLVLAEITHIVKNLEQWAQPQQVKTAWHYQPAKSFIMREPYGVTLIIAPFNYPFQLVMAPLIAAISGGNTAIIKPSEITPATTAIVKKIITETFATNYIAIVEGAKEAVTALIHAPFDYIFFTGSVAVGKIVASAAVQQLIPYTLELGGKSPAIVDQTANLKLAAKRIAWGKFTNAGQTCVAPDYVLVHESVAEKFIAYSKAAITKFYGSEPQQSPDFGRIVHKSHWARLQQLVVVEEKQITFGGAYDEDDLYMAPTLLENCTWQSPIMQDEIFGPLLPILVYSDLSQALYEIQQKPKPLAAYFFSENAKAVDYFLTMLPFGGGCINDTVTHVGSTTLPFGGVGTSGVGSYHGKASFECFTHAKSIFKKSTAIETNALFPPYNKRVKLVRKILR